MNIRKSCWSLLLAVMPSMVLAHAHLEKSVPAANAALVSMPAQIMLTFNEPARVTALTVTKEGSKDAQTIKLAAAEPAATFHTAAPQLAAGAYVLKWRALGDDNHVTSGSVRFTVTGK